MKKHWVKWPIALFVLPVQVTFAEISPRVSVNLQNTDVRSALYALAAYASQDMLVSDSVTGQITLQLHQVSWQQALHTILQARGLTMEPIGKVMHILRLEDLHKQEQLRLAARPKHLDLQAFKLQYRMVGEVKKQLEESKLLTTSGQMLADTVSNTLFIQDEQRARESAQRFIDATDQPIRQLMIETHIVEANTHFSRDLGVRLNFARADIAAGLNAQLPGESMVNGINLPIATPFASIAALFKTGTSRLISLELQAMQAAENGNVISSPRLLVADRSEANIEEGSDIPYPQASRRGVGNTAFKKATLGLRIRPAIAPDNLHINLDVDINKDSANYRQQVGGAPTVDTKRLHTQVQVEHGGTVILGGIFIEEQNRVTNQVPLLGDIPLLGALFRSSQTRQNRRELLVFITPFIVTPPARKTVLIREDE